MSDDRDFNEAPYASELMPNFEPMQLSPEIIEFIEWTQWYQIWFFIKSKNRWVSHHDSKEKTTQQLFDYWKENVKGI